MKKNDRQRFLVSSVLLGLSAGLSVLPMPNVAHAQTLNEYKADLAQRYPAYQAVLDREAAIESKAQGETIIASTGDFDENGRNRAKHITLDNSTQYKALRAEGDGWMTISMQNGATAQPMEVSVGDANTIDGDEEGGQINITVGNVNWNNPDSIKSNIDQVADMTNVKFRAESGNIVFTNGSTKVKAENIWGGNAYFSDGIVEIGSDEANVNALVKLEGNTKFNTGNWKNDAGQTISGGNYIVLTQWGTLEANSAQIFQKGMGLDGTNTNPDGVRQDANDAIKFEAGKLLLDDDSYNDAYLTQANKLIKEADGGTTEVVVKDTATKAAPVLKLDDVQDDNYAVGVTTDKSKITLGKGGDSTVNKLNATYLNMASTTDGSANSVTLKDKRTLYLGSNANNRELITVDNEKPAKSVDVQVQGGSKLTLGRFDVQNRLTGDVTLTDADSEIAVEAGQLTVGKIDAQTGTKINVGSGSALTTEGGIKLTGATMQVNGTVHNTDITGDSNSAILIGNNDSAGKMLIGGNNNAALAGTKVFLDPVWKDGATISDASQFALESSNNVDYLLTVGRNSLASLGTADSSKAIAAFGATGLNWGQNDISAALYLAKPVTVDATTGGIKVDGTATDIATDSAVAGTAEFADNSLLMVDASTLSGTAALTGAGSGSALKVADSAKLYLDNVSTGGTYTIATNFDTREANGWYNNPSNIITGKLFSATLNAGTITASRKKLQEALPGAVLPNIVDKMTFSAEEKAKSPASEFIAQATNGLYSDSMSTALINVAAQPAETVGATAAAVEHSLDFAQQAQGHLSFFNGADVKSDQAWIKYGHRNGSVDSLDIGGMSTGYDSSFNGVTVGFDLPAVDSFHHGFAFSYGKGSNDGAWEMMTSIPRA